MIVNQRTISRNLALIAEKYDLAMESPSMRGSIEAELYSKMAIIELCGWIEETVDFLLYEYVEQTVKDAAIRKTIREEVIDKVYGFRYRDDFRPLMEKIVGSDQFQKIKRRLENIRGRHTILCNELAELSKMRNRAAHTYWRGEGQLTFMAPSQTTNHFKTLVPIFKSIERMLHNLARCNRVNEEHNSMDGRE